MVHGWLRDTASATPSHVQVMHGRRVVAEAMADRFRPDLLEAGFGHGHYGFQARLTSRLPKGAQRLDLSVPATGFSLPADLQVPAVEPPRRVAVETLLLTIPGWHAADLLRRPACLGLPECHAAMGTPRLVDALFRFVLNRWPSPAEARLHATALQSGRIDPETLLVELLAGRERTDMPPGLPSPYNPEFPFTPLAGISIS